MAGRSPTLDFLQNKGAMLGYHFCDSLILSRTLTIISNYYLIDKYFCWKYIANPFFA